MKSSKCAFWILVVTVFWYLLLEFFYILESTLGLAFDDFYMSPVFNGISGIVSLLHYGSLLWILYVILRRIELLTLNEAVGSGE